MREAGVNLVSIGIFSWAKLESLPGKYTFGWLDRIIALLHQNDIAVDLATATASPPAWLARLHPESLPQDENGVRYYPGARQHYCPNSKAYQRAAAGLTRELAKRYGKNPALVMWHINNEYGCHIQACHCDSCAAAFRVWLRKKYGTLDGLNESWGTAFWSQWYYDWEEIFPPRKAPASINPAQQLDYKRFFSDSVLHLYQAEEAILRKATPKIPITTNFMGPFKVFDYFDWAPHLDLISWDSYPDPLEGLEGLRGNAFSHDLMRSLKQNKPFYLMEQTTGQVNWRAINSLRRPGVMRACSYQAVGRGADGVLFFQWRAAKAGAEKFHSAMVPHVDTRKSRLFKEVRELGGELKKLAGVAGSQIVSEVAIVLDWPNWWALELDSKPARIDYLERIREFHRYFYEANIPIDFVPAGGDWSRYKWVIAPHLYQLAPETAEKIRSYVAGGGTFLTNYFSGIVDTREHIHLGGYPALIRDVLGLWVEEWDPHGTGIENRIQWTKSRKISRSLDWSEVIHAEKAEVLAVFQNDFFKGGPAVTRNRFKKGTAYYLGTRLDETSMKEWLDTLCRELEINPVLRVPKGIEVTLRVGDSAQFLILVNHLFGGVTLDLQGWSGMDRITGQTCRGRIELEAHGVRIIELSSTGKVRGKSSKPKVQRRRA